MDFTGGSWVLVHLAEQRIYRVNTGAHCGILEEMSKVWKNGKGRKE